MSSTAVRSRPTADPYADTDVVDARAPRFLQATVGVGAVTALVTGWWWLYGLLALQLVVGLVLGRRWCLPCVAYFALVQPRVGEGRVEDARPPRFANKIGASVLALAFAAHLTGLDAAGTALGSVVAVLALLAASTGLCVGCELYKLAARLRGVRPGAVGALDLAELGAASGGPAVVQFTHPLCGDCRELEERLAAGAEPFHTVDVSRRPDLARRYHVAVVPAAFRVDGDGTVLERLA
jgi:thiol-disulfide isomerase/thioredoxin